MSEKTKVSKFQESQPNNCNGFKIQPFKWSVNIKQYLNEILRDSTISKKVEIITDIFDNCRTIEAREEIVSELASGYQAELFFSSNDGIEWTETRIKDLLDIEFASMFESSWVGKRQLELGQRLADIYVWHTENKVRAVNFVISICENICLSRRFHQYQNKGIVLIPASLAVKIITRQISGNPELYWKTSVAKLIKEIFYFWNDEHASPYSEMEWQILKRVLRMIVDVKDTTFLQSIRTIISLIKGDKISFLIQDIIFEIEAILAILEKTVEILESDSK